MLDIKLSDTLYQNDRIYFPKNDFTRTITKLYKNNRLVNTAYQGDLVFYWNGPVIGFSRYL